MVVNSPDDSCLVLRWQPARPVQAVSVRGLRIRGSNGQGASLCGGEIRPSRTSISSDRTCKTVGFRNFNMKRWDQTLGALSFQGACSA